MTAFTLYGARGSTNTDRVRLTLAEGGFTDYKLELLNLQKGEQKVCTHPENVLEFILLQTRFGTGTYAGFGHVQQQHLEKLTTA